MASGGPVDGVAGGAGVRTVRFSLRGEGPLERAALRARAVPTPALEAWAGVALSGALVAAVRLGITARLAADAGTAAEIAADLQLDPTATRLLLDCLCGTGHVRHHRGRYRLRRSSRRWLDPSSPRSVAHFIDGTGDYSQWWASLVEVTRTGVPVAHHDTPPDDPYWQRYIRGQYDLARLSAAEVARRFPLPADPRSLLDVGGGHGWYSAELCRRYPGLSSTVVDLPGSARVGRQIIAEAGLSDRVTHREGDVLNTDLGTGHDGALCFNLIHHLDGTQIVDLFAKVRAALRPGGSFGVLDAFEAPSRPRSATTSFVGMFMYLSSGSRLYPPAELHRWLAAAGFEPARRVPIIRMPGLTLYVATTPR